MTDSPAHTIDPHQPDGAPETHPEALSDAKGRLITAAAGLFADKGYAAVSIDQIAAAVGATKGLYYHHFKAKADILAEIVSTARAETLAAAEAALQTAGEDAPADKCIEALALAELTTILADPAAHRVAAQGDALLAGQRLSPAYETKAEAAAESRIALERLYQDAYRTGVKSARLEPLPPRFAVWLIRLPILAAADWSAGPNGAKTPADRVAEAVARFAAKGLLEPDPDN